MVLPTYRQPSFYGSLTTRLSGYFVRHRLHGHHAATHQNSRWRKRNGVRDIWGGAKISRKSYTGVHHRLIWFIR